jgi:class 3 adenylate cyclase
MKCPKCQYDNHVGVKFCEECGTKLPSICHNCGSELRSGTKFCGECGVSLTGETKAELSGVEIPTLEKIHSESKNWIPDALAQKYLSAEQQITAGENRPITVLFADISGFTPLSATKSSETIFHLVQDCFKQLVNVVAKYEGSISGFRGDGLLALFGAPILHENDTERAILAAIEMREAMKDYQLQVSIGINTAMMTVGEIQTQLHNEYTAYGTDINLAKRLQESAKPGQILVGVGSHRLTRRAFEFDTIPSLSLKGFSQPVTAYSVKQVKVHPEKIRGIEGLRARMIGREHEFTEVKETVDEWLNNQGQMVSIIGEAGIGKSRLVSELKTYLSIKDDKRFQYIEGRCVSIGQPISYWPFLDILRTYFNLSEGDDTVTIASKIIDGTVQIFPNSADETLPLLGQLLSVKYGNELDDRLKFATPEQIKHQTLMQLRDLFRTLAEKQPLLLILEDLHWADDFSLNLISLLMDELSHTPLMLLCIYRPDKEHQVSHLSDQAQRKCLDRYAELVLKKLSTVESRQLVEELLTIDNLPENVKNMILNKSEGNPFFIEEVIRSLIDRDLVYRSEDRWKAREAISNIDVPDTIQSVILARVDRLQIEAKYVLQCASVIGRLFKYSLLEHLSKQERNLNRYLIEFEEKDLVYPEHTIPELEYAFKHALTQEATYQSILEKKQKEFHLQIARGIEQLYYERLDEYYEELAQHYSKTDNAEKAVEYLLKAGEKAKKNYANETAISYFLEVLNTMDEKGFVRDHWKLEAQKGLGELYILTGKSVEAEKVFHEAITLGEKLKLSSRELVRLYAQVCEALHWQSRNDEAIKYAEMGLNLLGDDTECVEAMLINYQIAASSAGKGNVKEWDNRIQKDFAIVDKSEYSPELRNVYDAIAFYYANCFDRDLEMAWSTYKKWGRSNSNDFLPVSAELLGDSK